VLAGGDLDDNDWEGSIGCAVVPAGRFILAVELASSAETLCAVVEAPPLLCLLQRLLVHQPVLFDLFSGISVVT